MCVFFLESILTACPGSYAIQACEAYTHDTVAGNIGNMYVFQRRGGGGSRGVVIEGAGGLVYLSGANITAFNKTSGII